MACYRDRKVTVKFTAEEYAANERFLTHWETRTMSRLIRLALYDYRKAQTAKASTPQEAEADQADLVNAKKLTDSMFRNQPAKRGRPIGKKVGPVEPGSPRSKSDIPRPRKVGPARRKVSKG